MGQTELIITFGGFIVTIMVFVVTILEAKVDAMDAKFGAMDDKLEPRQKSPQHSETTANCLSG